MSQWRRLVVEGASLTRSRRSQILLLTARNVTGDISTNWVTESGSSVRVELDGKNKL